MDLIKRLFGRLKANMFVRNLTLAICSVIVFMLLTAIGLNIFTRHNRYEQVPDFEGMKLEEVMKAARKASLRIEVMDSLYVPAFEGGVVLDQTPAPGTEVKEGRRIFLTLNASTQRMVRIPYVTGYSLRQAKNNLEVAGLRIERLIYRPDMATNNVLEERYGSTVIDAGSDINVEVGTGITLIVGQAHDAKAVQAPKVVGFPEKEACSRLWELGLNVGKIKCDSGITALNRHEARVYEQSPGQARYLLLGQTVDIKLTLDREKVESGGKRSGTDAEDMIEQQLRAPTNE